MSQARSGTLRIGIDARFLNESGVGRYLRNLIVNLQLLDKKNQYFIFLLKKDYEQFNTSKNFQKVLADFSWYGFAEQFKLPKLLNKYKLDLIHFPHFNVPIFYTGRFVVTIHDLIHQHYQMMRSSALDPVTFKIKQLGYRRVFKTAVTKSQKILVPSKSVQQLLKKEWNINSDKIVVTHEAVDDKLLSIGNKMSVKQSAQVMEKFSIRKPYIFYVGNAHPHKNVEGLINAFMEIKNKEPDLKLVLSGYDHYFWERVREEFQDPNIIYTGFASDEELVILYKNAKCFVMPSLEEGFGIPILEAMALSCPVVSSNAGALPEVGGDACLYFDPHNSLEMVKAVLMVAKDGKLRGKLLEKGKKRVKLFSWEKLAKQTLEVYKNACSARS